ncbi:hypothetical protein [Rhizobium sp. RAF56]|uniref:hypothetical protein n=1 Tax=Rhizobium sp. RAF56 TaxID=3233062 RepID=UPI003F9A9C0B
MTDRPSAAAVADAAARTLSAPISDTAMAGRISARNQESPIVHVTIDRLEVRSAPSPKPAVEQRRERPQPAVSLSDYLRGNGSGRQG